MSQTGQTLAHALEDNTPVGEMHDRPPDLRDPQTQSSVAWEPESINPNPKACVRVHQARRLVLDEGAQTRPDPWPSLGVIIVDPDSCFG